LRKNSREWAAAQGEWYNLTSMTITLYAEPSWDSPYVFTVLVALKEKGLPFEVRVLDLARGEQREAGFARRSLTARVPCIEHEGFTLSESTAIVEYLDECFPKIGPTLLPRTLQERARYRQVMGFLRSDLMPLRAERPTTSMFGERAQTPLSDKARASADKLVRIADQLIPAGEGELFGDWSAADADLAFMLNRLVLNDDPVPERVANWARRQWQRPSVQTYVNWPRSR
jgi:glutathione S-transferase